MYCSNDYFDDAEKFLSAISLRGPNFATTGKYHWLFRGQCDSDRLLPRAWRKGELAPFIESDEPKTAKDYATIEFRIAQEFFTLADRRGLQLPEDTQYLRREILGLDEIMWTSWPDVQHLSLLALAQHNGLPTRLLDWTWNPYVAAYFAAEGVLRNRKRSHAKSTIEVSALAVDVASESLLNSQLGISTNVEEQIAIVTAPSAGNENLRAQEGAFTLVRLPESEDTSQDLVPIALDDLIASFQGDGTHYTLLYRFELDASQTDFLLYLLQAEGVSTSSVWPGYHGVADEVTLRLGPSAPNE